MGDSQSNDMGLADAISRLRAELSKAQAEGTEDALRFGLGPIEVELLLELQTEKGGDAGLRFSVISVGGHASRTRGQTHRVMLTLNPKQPDGSEAEIRSVERRSLRAEENGSRRGGREVRVAKVVGHWEDGSVTVGSGYVLTDELVLTAAHIVREGQNEAESVAVELSTGLAEDASVVWPRESMSLDVAVIKITTSDEKLRRELRRPVRWGRLTAVLPGLEAHAQGFPDALRMPDGKRLSEHVSGRINPGVADHERHDLLLDGAHPLSSAQDPSPWSGLSGAALLTGTLEAPDTLILGVVALDQRRFQAGRLSAVPAWKLLGEQSLATLLAKYGCPARLESVELARVFTPPAPPIEQGSPARLLAAEMEIVPFRGREALITELLAWCRQDDEQLTYLITGEGGQGKTRLALELSKRIREEGWIAGFVDRTADRDIQRLAAVNENLLLVVDYAETRAAQLAALFSAMRQHHQASRIRVVLLARSAGEWWQRLRHRDWGALDSARTLELKSADGESVDSRRAAYDQALKAFVEALSRLAPDHDWHQPEDRNSIADLSAQRFTSVLTLHMTALLSLLSAAEDGEAVDAQAEDRLLAHEQRYWEDSARDLHLSNDFSTLRLSATAATLFGASDRREAELLLASVPGLTGEAHTASRTAVARWLHDLYPVGPDRYWGPLQPDRLGERLVENVDQEEPELVDTLMSAASPDQTVLAVSVMARIGERLAREGSTVDAARWYQRCADAGSTDAAYHLGRLLERQEPEQAERWLRRAAREQHMDAAFYLARLLLLRQESDEAEAWYEQAADGSHVEAAFELGRYWRGKDNEEAQKWYEKAAQNPHYRAALELGELIQSVDAEHAKEFFKLAGQTMPEGYLALGELNWAESGWDEARNAYRHAMDMGNSHAAYQLGWLEDSHGDPTKTLGLWQQAADKGDRDAAYHLGERLWANGDPGEARRYFGRARGAGHQFAGLQIDWLAEAEHDGLSALDTWQRVVSEQRHGHEEAERSRTRTVRQAGQRSAGPEEREDGTGTD